PDADREENAEIVENGVPGRRHEGDVEQVWLPKAQQPTGYRKRRNGQHQRAAERLQRLEGWLHGTCSRIRLPSVLTLAPSGAARASAARLRQGTRVTQRKKRLGCAIEAARH